MNTVKGSIVKAVAGREKNGFFVVLDCDSVFAYIADGKRRKVEKPKKKKGFRARMAENYSKANEQLKAEEAAKAERKAAKEAAKKAKQK